MNELIKFWLEIMKEKECRFAFIQTTRAIYDRVAVVGLTAVEMIIEYPRMVKGKWTIAHETISRDWVEKARYYVS